jgi:hypothetical protein
MQEIETLESFFKNKGLDEKERTEKKCESTCLASIFGGTSIC